MQLGVGQSESAGSVLMSGSQEDAAGQLRRMDVVGVRIEAPSEQPIVLLKEAAGLRYLPMWIGAVEATGIAFALEGIPTARPMTHDLMRDILVAAEVGIARATITELRDGVFYTVLLLSNGAEVSARPSDAIALALRMSVPVWAVEAVLAEAGTTTPEELDPS